MSETKHGVECAAGPSVSSDSTWSEDQGLDIDLRCPVCLNTFDDPRFVCRNHHSLCRSCHQAIEFYAEPDEARCPQCRKRMMKPVEDSRTRALIEARRQLGRAMQATCKGTGDSGGSCQRRARHHCGHCDRDLCDLHYAKDQLAFENYCQALLRKADRSANSAETNEARVLTELDRITDSFIKLVQLQRDKIRQSLSASAPASALRAEAAALRRAIDAGDMREVRAASGRVSAARKQADRLFDAQQHSLLPKRLNRSGNLTDAARQMQKLGRADPREQMQTLATIAKSQKREHQLETDCDEPWVHSHCKKSRFA